jgi:hypothetical protein
MKATLFDHYSLPKTSSMFGAQGAARAMLKFKPSDSDNGLQMLSRTRAPSFAHTFRSSPRQTCAYYVTRADSVSKT